MKVYALKQEKILDAIVTKLVELYSELDPWDDEEEIKAEAQMILDAIYASEKS